MLKNAVTALILGSAIACAKDELRFDHKTIEVKVQPREDIITVVFPFKNVSGVPVKLGKIVSTCDCTNGTYQGSKNTLAPGEKDAVEVSMQTGSFSGTVQKEMTVHALDSEYKLTIKAVIPRIVEIVPKKLEWKQGEAATPKKITIKIDDRQLPLKLKTVSLEGDDFDYSPVTIKAGKEYQIIVTPKSTAAKSFNSIWIVTDSDIPRYSRFLGALTVKPQK